MNLRVHTSAVWPSSARSPHTKALLAAAVMVALAVPAVAQLQFEELARGLPPRADSTMVTASGDVDGDGDLDLVVGNYGQTRLYRNNGTGAFTDVTATHMPVAFDYTTALLLGDVDGDGDLDLVVGNSSRFSPGGQSRLYLNNGTGAFTDATATRLPATTAFTSSLSFGDVDGDGDPDIVVGNATVNYGGPQSLLYLNNGTGTFTISPTFYVGRSTSMALGDVDGDGDLDLAAGDPGNVGSNLSRLYLNDGTGTFTDVTLTHMPAASLSFFSISVLFGDVDGDGDLDLVAWNLNRPSFLYLNNGTGSFTVAPAANLPVGNSSDRSLRFGDVDLDGDADLVLGRYNQQNRLYLNNGAGTFTDATATRMPVGTSQTMTLMLGDMDGDGDLDLVEGRWNERNSLHLNNGAGAFTDTTATGMPPAFDQLSSVALGDVDGDGDVDWVVGAGRGINMGLQSRLYLNSGTGVFTDATATRLPVGRYTTASVALGDVDGDGDLDLVLGNEGNWFIGVGERSRLYLNTGTGTFVDATIGRMPAPVCYATSVLLGDVDADGDLDMVLGNGYGQSRLYRNNGTGTFTDVTGTSLPVITHYTHSLALGDVDGDGDLDLVLGNRYEQNHLYLNNGTGTFTDSTVARMPVGTYNTRSLAFGDVDGDGDIDLAVGNLGQQSRLYVNNGTGTFTDATSTRMPIGSYGTASLLLGDVDDDGDLDMAVGNNLGWNPEQSRLYLNSGAGTFTDATATRLPVGDYVTRALAFGDLDRDGDLDLVVGNAGQSRIYQNLLRQLDAPFVLHVGRTYELDVYSRSGSATQLEIAYPYFATATAHIPLPPFGTVGIDPNQMIALPPFVVPQPAGVGSLLFPVPNVPALAGITIYSQALLQAYPGPLRLTNVVGDVILR